MINLVDDQPCYVLHRRPFKESSLIIDLFSLQHGRLSVVAKSVSKSRTSGAASLQVFTPLLVSWRGKSDLKTLSSHEVPTAANQLVGMPLYCGYYLNELLLYLLPEHEPFVTVFDAYAGAIANLCDGSQPDLILRRFETNLLVSLGLAPDFQTDSHGNAVETEKAYRFNADYCFELRSSSVGVNEYFDKMEREMISGETLLWLSSLVDSAPDESPVTEKIRRESKWLMRKLIAHALHGRTLKSREMIKQLSEAKW